VVAHEGEEGSVIFEWWAAGLDPNVKSGLRAKGGGENSTLPEEKKKEAHWGQNGLGGTSPLGKGGGTWRRLKGELYD